MFVEKLYCPVGESHCILFDEVRTLRKQVVTDPLTGLFNVRHFRKSLEHELERTRRTGCHFQKVTARNIKSRLHSLF
ncbi:MAG TPA: hypothetical protein DE015_01470 [Oceanospirillales bacterium]|nr:hypothetical protein [Oceanospirillales bacterium]